MIDVDHQINAVRRTVGTRILEAGEARTVTISRTYDAAIEDVWDACTNPERIPRWFLPVTGDFKVGGRFQLEGHAGGTIERCEPPTSFTATWESGEQRSGIELRLSAEPDGRTRFELQHTVPVDSHWTQFGPGAVGVGWEMATTGLSLHLASGEQVDPEQFAAWSASDEGRQFVTESSRGWRAADIAAGTDSAVADAAATRTTAAYTGADA